MQRIKMTEDYLNYRAGQVVTVDNNIAHGLIDAGKAVLTKDMVQSDYQTKKPFKAPLKSVGRKTKWQP